MARGVKQNVVKTRISACNAGMTPSWEKAFGGKGASFTAPSTLCLSGSDTGTLFTTPSTLYLIQTGILALHMIA